MTRKQLIAESIKEMETFGETYIGMYEIRGDEVIRYLNALNKEIAKKYEDKIVVWSAETGYAWIV